MEFRVWLPSKAAYPAVILKNQKLRRKQEFPCLLLDIGRKMQGMLQEKGAEIICFSPIHDTKLPDHCDALLIGGGYPELHVNELSQNDGMKYAIRQAFDKGMPVVAECGGFMYLHDAIIDKDGASHAMVGVVSAVCEYKGKLVRFGYIEIKEKQSRFIVKGERMGGHEFHYFDSTDNGENCIAMKPVTGKEYPCVIIGERYWLGFPHLYYPSNPSFAENFVKMAEEYNREKESA